MLQALVILQIIDKLLGLHLERIKSMSPEQAEAYWDRFERRMEFWEKILDRVHGKDDA